MIAKWSDIDIDTRQENNNNDNYNFKNKKKINEQKNRLRIGVNIYWALASAANNQAKWYSHSPLHNSYYTCS